MPQNDANIASLLLVITELKNTIDRLNATIDGLNNQLAEKDKHIKILEELVLAMRRERYGSKSEKSKSTSDAEQQSLFNEAEAEYSDNPDVIKEPVERNSKDSAFNVRKPKGKREFSGIVEEEEFCSELPPDKRFCPNCGSPLKNMGTRYVREFIEYIPAKIKIIRYYTTSYECRKCRSAGRRYAFRSSVPKSILNHSLASAGSIAHVILQKYVYAMPLYRQESYWHSIGLDLSRATMANWMIRCNEDYFSALLDYMKSSMLKNSEVLYIDETPVQVLKEPGKKPTNKSYMWVYATDKKSNYPAIIFDYKPGRSGDNPKAFLKGFKGYIHTDGFKGYNKVANKDIIRCCCWAHVRRYFFEAGAVGGVISSANKLQAENGVAYCNKLFELEKTFENLTPEERCIKRLEQAKPILEAFWAWLDTVNPLPKSKLGKAVDYAKNHKEVLENYLRDGRCSLSNNTAENCIRPFTVGRKNWLFADTVKGAAASASIYSLVESAKANGLDVYEYFCRILETMPNIDFMNKPELLEDLMPWSEKMKSSCKKETKKE